MSETQIIKRVTPSVKVSTTDNHRILTHPGAVAPQTPQPRQPRRNGLGQPLQPQTPDVVFKPTPIDASMQAGGTVVRRPGGALAGRAAAAAAPAPVRSVPQLTPDQAALCATLLDAHLTNGPLVGEPSPEAHELARATFTAVAKLANQ